MCSARHTSQRRDRSRSPRRDRSRSPRRDRSRSPRRDRSRSPRRDRSRSPRRDHSRSPCRDRSRSPRRDRSRSPRRDRSRSPRKSPRHYKPSGRKRSYNNAFGGNNSVNVAGYKARVKTVRKAKKVRFKKKQHPITFPIETPVHLYEQKLPPEDLHNEYKDSENRTYKGAKNAIKLHVPKVVCGFLNSSSGTRNLRLGVDDKNCEVHGFSLDPIEQDQIRRMISQTLREKVVPFSGINWSVSFEFVDAPADKVPSNKRLYVILISVPGLCPSDPVKFYKLPGEPMPFLRGIAETFVLTQPQLDSLCESRRNGVDA